MNTWQLQEAKAHLSDLVKQIVANGPQKISVHGKEKVVVISIEDYRRLTKPKESLVKFLRKSPLVGVDLSCERDQSSFREIEL